MPKRPWTPYAVLLWHRASLLRLETHVLPIAACKSSRIRHSPNSGTVRRFPVLPTPCAKTREFGEAEFSDCLPVSAFASGNSYFINSLVQKLQNSAQAEFWDCTPVLAFETGFLIRGFGSLYNLGLPKEQRFFWKGTKAKSCKT